ncbi:MAG TPA: hypothetical protein DD490_02190, partial [Acidobacteria bacterium]|nr:hypothetical protein [Acidobacteriota bacterium]
HRYPDLARLWHRSVMRDLVPAFQSIGLDTGVIIYCDGGREVFDPRHFPGATLEAPRSEARDFIEFYDYALHYDCEYVLFLDADVFLLNGAWPASQVARFRDPDVAAVSLLHRPDLPGSIYALICRRDHYTELEPPILAAHWQHIERWPGAVHRDPGAMASIRLRDQGKTIVMASPDEMGEQLTDFHSTTLLRMSRDQFGGAIGEDRFQAQIARNVHFLQGAYDNLLLGLLYQHLFQEPYAPGPDGTPLAGSLTLDALQRILRNLHEPKLRARIAAYLPRSNRAILRLAEREGFQFQLPEGLRPVLAQPPGRL